MNITNTQMRRIYVLLRDNGVTEQKEDLVPQFCDQRTEHVSELESHEANAMIEALDMMLKDSGRLAKGETAKHPYIVKKANADGKTINNDEAAIKMRKKILYYLASMGFTTEGGKFDYSRINAFIENIGSNNPEKQGFNFLSNDQLKNIVNQVSKIYEKSLNKR